MRVKFVVAIFAVVTVVGAIGVLAATEMLPGVLGVNDLQESQESPNIRKSPPPAARATLGELEPTSTDADGVDLVERDSAKTDSSKNASAKTDSSKNNSSKSGSTKAGSADTGSTATGSASPAANNPASNNPASNNPASNNPGPAKSESTNPASSDTGSNPKQSSICNGTDVFSDNFDGNAIDANKWKSGFYWGHQNATGDEVGTYVQGITDARVFEQSGGTLKIRSTKEGSTYYTGALTALDNRTPLFSEGCYEARMKFPDKGNGTWPAFWLISNTGGPSSQLRPEIDVIEHVGSEPEVPQYAAHQLGKAPNFLEKVEVDGPDTDVTQFHTYGVKWTSQGVAWYFDGQFVGSTQETTDVPMYLHLNMAMGGAWAKSPEASLWAGGPPTMEVDWVNVTK